MGALDIAYWTGLAWQDITFDVPFMGDPVPGLVPFEIELTRESNIAVLRFSVNGGSYSGLPTGTEIVVNDGLTRLFGGYITTRERIRQGPLYGANFECQDYNSLLDRIVIPSYTIDDGDDDQTEIQTLRNTYLGPHGVTNGTINVVQAALEEIEIQGSFRSAMESIAAQAGGAVFFIDPDKQLNYAAVGSDILAAAVHNLSDDLTVANSHEYGDFVERVDETRRLNRIYIVGDGIEGWYPAADGGEAYQTIVYDSNVTTQDALDALGAAITGDFGSSITEYSLKCWYTDLWSEGTITVRHSDFIGGAGSALWARRVVMRCISTDSSERELVIEFGDHTAESDYLAPAPGSPGTARSPALPHAILGTFHSDADEQAPTRGDFILADSTPIWTVLNHPASANRYITSNAADPTWAANITLDDDAYVGITGGGRLVFDSTPNPDQVEVTAADLYFATTAHGIIHVDGVAAGSVLVADGTRYVPGDFTDIGAAPADAQYLTLALDGDLSAERRFVPGNGLAGTDGGADGDYDLVVDLVAAWSGLEFSGGDLRIDLDATFNAWTAKHTFSLAGGAIELDVATGDPAIIFDCAGADRFTIGVDDSDNDIFKINSGATLADPSDFEIDSSGNVEIAGNISSAEYWYHLGDTDTNIRYQADNITVTVGAVTFLDLVEGATDYIDVGAQVRLNSNDLFLDTDDDSYLHASGDDVVDFVLATASGELGITINGGEDFTFTANSFNVKSGSVIDLNSVLEIRSHGDVTATGADIYADSQMGLAADDDVWVFIDANSSGTGAAFHVANNGETTGANELMRVTEGPLLLLNTTSETGATIGIRIDQASNGDDILAFKSAITHGMTTHAETDQYGQFGENNDTYGGMRVRGLRDSSSGSAAHGALNLVGYLGETANTTKTTAGHGVVQINAAVRDGATTGVTAVGTDGNLCTIENNGTTRYIFDAEGSAHADVEWTTFADHNDIALLGNLEAAFGEFADAHQAELEALGIAHFDSTPGHAMVNWTRLSMLLVGAVRQLAARQELLEGRLT